MAKPKQLSEEVINEVRGLYARGEMTQTQIAKMYEISQGLVSKIVNNYIHKSNVGLQISGAAECKVGYNYSYGD
jgi:DNA-binding transcriptional regulator LsrR (DeoR family)